jgi:hypothetical protein
MGIMVLITFLPSTSSLKLNTFWDAAIKVSIQSQIVSISLFAVAVLVAKLAFAGKEITSGEERDKVLFRLRMQLSRGLLF